MSNKNITDPEMPDFDLDKFLGDTSAPPELEDEQLNAFIVFLESHQGMDMEMLDGFLCALICGPDVVSPEAFIPYIFGGKEPNYSSPAHAEEMKNALQQHWDHIQGMMENGETYMPFFYSDSDFKVSANDWSLGFALGIDKYRDSWQTLLSQSQKEENLLTPVLTLYMEKHPDNTEGLIHAEDRELLVKSMIDNLPLIYQHFNEAREKKNPMH